MARTAGGDTRSSQNKKHALVIPLMAQAHAAGIYRLAVQLAKRGVTITFVALEKDIPRMKTYEELQGLDFNLISAPSMVSSHLTISTSKNQGKLEAIRDFIKSTGVNFNPILQDLKAKQKAGLPGPTCIIFDRFLDWVKDVSEELNIPMYTFFSCGAIMVRYLQELPKLFSEGTLAIKDDGKLLEFEGHVYISGLPPLQYSDIPLSARVSPQFGISIAQTLRNVDAIIINTFKGLEHPQIEEIQLQLAEQSVGGKNSKLFLVGPVANASTDKDRSFQLTPGLDNRGAESLQWLDSQLRQSVVYICCGSIVRWNASMIYELAVALEATVQRFLWVLQIDPSLPNLDDALPAGFRERTSGRGLIMTTWVPQLQILAHPSVGCFLSHCGWNSLIESVTSGLPMICWPQIAEQHMNCRYLVDVLKIGVQVGRGLRKGSEIGYAEFDNALRIVMVEEQGKTMRARVQELMSKAKAALSDGGSSHAGLSEIVEFIPSADAVDIG